MHLPWTDRKGQFSGLKTFALVCGVLPGLFILYWLTTGQLGALPTKAAMKLLGLWSIRFLLLSLALTPLQRILQWPRLAIIRRIAGVTAASYAGVHFSFFLPYSGYDAAKVVSEIVLRPYLSIGFAALLGLAVLAFTSTDRMVSRLGALWKKLHRAVYVIAPLGLLHYAMQEKLDVTAPLQLAGLFALLMAYRLMAWRRWALSPATLLLTALAVAAVTAGFEAAWYATASGIDPLRILAANASTGNGWRPAVVALAAGLAVALIALVRPMTVARRPITA